MEIVCDTNIWYQLGQNPPDADFLKENCLIGTFHSIDELSRTPRLITQYDLARKAIQAIMTHPRKIFYEPPLTYLKRLNNPKFTFNPAITLKGILEFTRNIANGANLIEEQKVILKTYIDHRQNELQKAADVFNNAANKIRPNIKNTQKHRNENSIPLNRKFISQLVELETKDGGLDENFDWSKIELFENVLKVTFNDLETGASAFTMNDLYDFFNMIYVTPQRLYWTEDKKWINIIKRSGMEKYLFKPDEKKIDEK